MGKVFDGIDDAMEAWLAKQKVFFVATAPHEDDGLVNCSPKGMDTFRILGPRAVAYLDLTGSGVETIAHLRENGRIVVMMCAFEGPPRIVRFHGRGRVLPVGTPGYEVDRHRFPELPGARSIIAVDVDRISDSCGYSVPRYEYRGDRDALTKWAVKRGPEGVREYVEKRNTLSLDGLPGLTPVERVGRRCRLGRHRPVGRSGRSG